MATRYAKDGNGLTAESEALLRKRLAELDNLVGRWAHFGGNERARLLALQLAIKSRLNPEAPSTLDEQGRLLVEELIGSSGFDWLRAEIAERVG